MFRITLLLCGLIFADIVRAQQQFLLEPNEGDFTLLVAGEKDVS